jgi:hypothetical protein
MRPAALHNGRRRQDLGRAHGCAARGGAVQVLTLSLKVPDFNP